MKIKVLILTFIFSTILSHISYSQKEGKIKVIVKNEAGQVLTKAVVVVDGNKPCTTNRSGTCTFTPERKLQAPFNVKLQKTGYEIKEFSYYEEDKEIEVIAVKASSKNNFVYLYINNEDKTPASNLKLKVLSKEYTTDLRGMLKIPAKNVSVDQITIEGKEVLNSELKGKAIYLVVKDQELNDNLEELVFNQYKSDFEAVTSAVVQERRRLEEDNEAIINDINAITRKLQTETNLTKEHRRELEAHLTKLEKTLNENSRAFKKAEERTLFLMENLKKIILKKDSLNLVTVKKFQISEGQRIAAEKQKLAAEEKSKNNLIIFSIVALGLSLILVVFYIITIKLRKQKKNLSKSNHELMVVKGELNKKIIEVKKQKYRIEDQNKELDLFVYKASHDIKGPLRSLLGLTSIGLKTITDKGSLEIFNHIHKSITKLDLLLADLLMVSKAKSAAVVKTRIVLKEKIWEVIESFKNVNGFENVSFTIDVPEGYELITDKNLIYSILQNFIENALKYSDPQKENCYLKIKVEENNEKVFIRFEDNGLGISPENISKIFDMFYKVNESTNGTGLGLYLIKNNIEKLGGKLNVESSLGKGSVFTVEFEKELSLV